MADPVYLDYQCLEFLKSYKGDESEIKNSLEYKYMSYVLGVYEEELDLNEILLEYRNQSKNLSKIILNLERKCCSEILEYLYSLGYKISPFQYSVIVSFVANSGNMK